MDNPAAVILPFYFVADESYSMAPVIEDLNRGLEELISKLQTQPFACSKARLSVIGFADQAQLHMGLTDILNIESVPRFSAGGSTSYAAAFRELYNQIPQDVSRLRADYLVNRPCVFYLTDGEPNPGWEEDYSRLVAQENELRPNILSFGIGEANPKIISEIATRENYAFIHDGKSAIGEAINRFCVALTQSIISSGIAIGGGKSELVVEEPEGFLSIPVETV